MEFRPEDLPFAAAALVEAALAIVLLRVGHRRETNRALAYYFASTAVYDATSFVANAQTSFDAMVVWGRAADAVGVADGLLLIAFGYAYVREVRGDARSSHPELFLVAGLALAALVYVTPGGLYVYFPDGRLEPGPFVLVNDLLDQSWSVVGFILARHALASRDARATSTLLLGSVLVFFFAAFDLQSMDTNVLLLLDGGAHFALRGNAAFSILRSALALAFVVYLLIAMRGLHGAPRRAALAGALLVVAGGLIGLGMRVLFEASAAPLDAPGVAAYLLIGLVFLTKPLVVAYAVLRHQLLDIDLKVKIGISRGALAAIFLAVFFVVTQVAQNMLQGYGVLAGGIAAGLMLFAIAPLQRAAERIADTAMPGVGNRRDPTSREVAYKHALRFALSEGGVTREEEMQLAHLADELGLSTQVATRLRHEVEVERGTSA